MTSGIAHDFNNMLAIITGNIDLIEIEEDKDKILEKVQIIKKTAMDSAKTRKGYNVYDSITNGRRKNRKDRKERLKKRTY